MDFGISGKRAVVTGASQGIGRSTALSLAREGVRVIAVARRGDVLAEVVREMGGEAKDHGFIAADLMKPGEPTRVALRLVDEFKDVDIVIHNVGGTLQVKNPLASVEEWHRVWHFNAGIAIEMNAVLIPPMKAKGWGRVVHVSSISGVALRGSAPYAASKAFLNAYVTSLARGVAKEGVVVSGVMPGAVFAPGGHWDNVAKNNPEMMHDFLRHHMAIGRLGTADEIAPLVVFLCSQQATFTVGGVMPIDGGTM